MKIQKIFRSAMMIVMIVIFGIMSGCSSEKSNDQETSSTDQTAIPTDQTTSPIEQTTMKEVKQEMQDVIQVLKEYGIDQRDEAIKETKAALEKMDNHIDAMQTRIDNNWDKMNETAQEKAKATLKALRKQRAQLAEWQDSLKSSSAAAWEDIKKGFSDAYSSFYDAWEKAKNE